MVTDSYRSPVDRLLTLGDPSGAITVDTWLNYTTELGLTLEHLPELVRLATSRDEEFEDWQTNPAVYAPIHAWRAIGQLRAESAIAPLLTLLTLIDKNDDDWISEELPEVFGLIGPVALPPLADYLADAANGLWARVAASKSLEQIGTIHPDSRSRSVAALTQALSRFANNDPELNGFIVCNLLDLQAVESASTIEQAFAANAVEDSLAGDWECVQVTLGLKSPDDFPTNRYLHAHLRSSQPVVTRVEPSSFSGGGKSAGKSKERAKNKMARQSRKKNRQKRK